MKIFFSNICSAKGLEKYLPVKIDCLENYLVFRKKGSVAVPPFCQDFFLDSGAFSAFTRGTAIDIDHYAEFVRNNQDSLFVYANLDVIGDPQATWTNQLYLEQKGLLPLATFHCGSDLKWLSLYSEKYEYIALGGLVPMSQNRELLFSCLDECWKVILKTDPTTKVHGFGINNEDILFRYPWFSVDASSAHLMARYGGIYTPWNSVKINPEVNPNDLRWRFNKPNNLKAVRNYVESLGLPFSFEEAQEKTPEGTIRRCAVSVMFFLALAEKCGYGTECKPIKKTGFGIF